MDYLIILQQYCFLFAFMDFNYLLKISRQSYVHFLPDVYDLRIFNRDIPQFIPVLF